MKLRGRIIVGFLALAAICVLLLLSTGNRALRDLEETRRSLRQQGFKTDLSEFNLATSPEERQRAAVLGATTRAAITNRARPGPIRTEIPGLLRPVGKNIALVTWRQEKLKGYRNNDLWPELREVLKTERARLEAMRQAALSGPIRFEPIGRETPSPAWLLPYLADLKQLETTLGALTMLALHDGQPDEAWTNLLAATCLVTAYTPEPIETSHMVRLACVPTAYDTTWNVLQAGKWTEAQLAEFQRRWEAVDFWSGLPETAALSRVNMAGGLELERQESPYLGITLHEALNSPRRAWFGLQGEWRRICYRHQGSYTDEKAMLLYYRDRELELRRAVRSPTWAEMRQLPGVTNLVPFKSQSPSRMGSIMNMRQMALGFHAEGKGLLGRAAEAEARRRLIITAIALERYRAWRGSYPEALQELVPQLLHAPPLDFMDGQPLRYQRTDDGHFVLYSVGLDCVDNGGEMRRPRRPEEPYDEVSSRFGFRPGTDLVWPRPASEAEAERQRLEEERAEAERRDLMEERRADAQWSGTARRQAKVEAILSAPPPPMTNEPTYRGRPLSAVLRNENASGTNRLTLADMLTLRQVVTGSEPEAVTFELPINYDVLIGLGTLELYIDPCEDEDSDEGCHAGQVECSRATNGNCRLVWSTIYEAPGKHALQAGLALNRLERPDQDMGGPLAPFVVTNLCQFSLSSAYFERQYGTTLQARLPEPNGVYSLEFKAPGGPLLKTIAGATLNRVIKVHWDLMDDRGRVCTNEAFDTVLHITLPDSGRSQTLKGP